MWPTTPGQADIERISKLQPRRDRAACWPAARASPPFANALGLERRARGGCAETAVCDLRQREIPSGSTQLDQWPGRAGGISQILHEAGGKAGPGILLEIGGKETAGRQITGGRKQQDFRHPGHQQPGEGERRTPWVPPEARHGHRAVHGRIPGGPGIILKQMLDQGTTLNIPSGWSPAGTRCWEFMKEIRAVGASPSGRSRRPGCDTDEAGLQWPGISYDHKIRRLRG